MVIDYSHVKGCGCRLHDTHIYSYILWDGWGQARYPIGGLYFWENEYRDNLLSWDKPCGTVVDRDHPREMVLCETCCKRNGLLW